MTNEKSPRRIKLIIDSNLGNVPLVGTSINKLCSTLALSEDECCEIEICVVEAVNNSIIHAYGRKEGYEIEVVFSIYRDQIVIEIKDKGKSIKKLTQPALNFDPKDRQNLPVGGMGLFIISKVMNEVRYITDKGVNTLTLTKILDTHQIHKTQIKSHC